MTPADLSPLTQVEPRPLHVSGAETQHLCHKGQSGSSTALYEGAFDDAPGSTGSWQEHHGRSAAIALRESALDTEVAELRSQSLSANSQRGYAADWRNFSAWCVAQGREALPASPETAGLYMADRSATLANASLTRAIAAISRQHREAGFQSPTQDARFRQLMAGIRRRNRAPQDAKQALLVEDLFAILKQIPGLGRSEAVEHRDRALLVIGFCGALRRSELVNLDVEDVRSAPEGIILTLRWSKTDVPAQVYRFSQAHRNIPFSCAIFLD